MDGEEYRTFNQWVLWSREERALTDPFEKRATEYIKASIEFSKLIITNLHLINAGGLLATPTIANFLNFTKAPDAEKFYLIGVPGTLFAFGLLLATLCAFFTYRNYQHLAENQRAAQWNAVMSTEIFFQLFQTEPRFSDRKREMAANAEIISASNRKVRRTHWSAHIAGWGSAACFVASCTFMALNMR